MREVHLRRETDARPRDRHRHQLSDFRPRRGPGQVDRFHRQRGAAQEARFQPCSSSRGHERRHVARRKRILDQGVAVIYYNNYDLGMEGSRRSRETSPTQASTTTSTEATIRRVSDGLGLGRQPPARRDAPVRRRHLRRQRHWRHWVFTFGQGRVRDRRLRRPDRPDDSARAEHGRDPALRIMDKLPGGERTDYNYKGLNWLSRQLRAVRLREQLSNAVKLPFDTHVADRHDGATRRAHPREPPPGADGRAGGAHGDLGRARSLQGTRRREERQLPLRSRGDPALQVQD